MRKKSLGIIVCLFLAVAGRPAAASLVGEFDGSGQYNAFSDEAVAYRSFMGTSQNQIDFSEIPLGTGPVGDFYAASKGVTFSNEGSVLILPEGSQVVAGWYQGSLAGYGQAGMPAQGSTVYNKLYDDSSNPLTISFAAPVSSVGGYIANSAGGASSLTVEMFDSAGNLLNSLTANVDIWGNADNSEGFWGVRMDNSDISKVTIVSSGWDNIASLGNVEWSSAGADSLGSTPSVPEPSIMVILAFGGVLALLRRRRLA